MSRRRNGTNRAAAQLGLNPYGWGNGGKRKSPRELAAPIGANEITNTGSIPESGEESNGKKYIS